MTRTGRPPISLPLDEIRDRALAGQSLRQMAAAFGCSLETIRRTMVREGIPRLPPHSCRGERNPSWKGGRYQDGKGYWLSYAPDHPQADSNGRVREHRLVMEQMIGRHLLPTEVVDHIDRNGLNNDPSNLRLFASNADHLAATLRGRMPRWTEEGKARIAEGGRQSKRSSGAAHTAVSSRHLP